MRCTDTENDVIVEATFVIVGSISYRHEHWPIHNDKAMKRREKEREKKT